MFSLDALSLDTLPLGLAPATVLLYCIAIAGFLIYVPFGWVSVARLQLGYQPSTPRAMFDQLPPFAQRATWAHQNSFEAFMLFAAAALTCYVIGNVSVWAAQLAVIFLAARLLYSICYVADWPWARSLMWALGSACIGGLFLNSLSTL
ncbi:MAG: MAPEG family protein [Cyanobacteria bacterium P01_D01_bin.123]